MEICSGVDKDLDGGLVVEENGYVDDVVVGLEVEGWCVGLVVCEIELYWVVVLYDLIFFERLLWMYFCELVGMYYGGLELGKFFVC